MRNSAKKSGADVFHNLWVVDRRNSSRTLVRRLSPYANCIPIHLHRTVPQSFFFALAFSTLTIFKPYEDFGLVHWRTGTLAFGAEGISITCDDTCASSLILSLLLVRA